MGIGFRRVSGRASGLVGGNHDAWHITLRRCRLPQLLAPASNRNRNRGVAQAVSLGLHDVDLRASAFTFAPASR
jgi:hypothetical protein